MLSKNAAKWILIVAGTLVWSLSMVKSGLVYSFGMGFWGPNGHDGIWHLALAQSLSRFTLDMPVFTGLPIQNYHIGFDLLLAFLHLITRIPVSVIYFQILPPVFAFFIGLLTYEFVKLWKKDNFSAWWATLFVYFGGSWGWILGGGESLFWAQQSISTLINPPFALSLIILVLSLISLLKKRFWTSVILLAILPQIKVYAGVLVFAGLLIASLKNTYLFKIILPAALIAAALYLPLNFNSTNLIVFKPLWFLQNLFTADRLNWPQMFSALQSYYSGQNYLKGIPAFSFALLIFILGNLGTRIIFIKTLKMSHYIDHIFITIIGLGIIFPMLFLQQGTAWNTIQFFYYSLFAAGIYAGISLVKFPKVIQIILVLLTLPTTYQTLKHYLPDRPPAKISQNELAALKFLSHQPQGIVYTLPFDKTAADAAAEHPPRPLYLYESTAYVAAFSNQPVWLEDTVNLNITGYDWQTRLNNSPQNITYYYLTKDTPFPNTHLIFSNPEVYIYQTD